MDYLGADFKHTPSGKCRLAGDAFVEDRPQGEEIAAPIDVLSSGLLR
jgi:hypothetical protein